MSGRPPFIAAGARLRELDDDELRALGACMVVAPHPDDESLGCAGLILKLRRLGAPVSALLVSDGSGSHPGSKAYPPARLAAIRAQEAAAALAILGVDEADTIALGLADRYVPGPGEAGFEEAVARTLAELERRRITAVIAPWRRDPHHDHRASWAIAAAAIARHPAPRPRLLEYPIWAWESADLGDQPGAGEALIWRLGVADEQPRKQAAIAAHRSQLGLVIDDDPTGFVLTPAMLEHFAAEHEYFFELGAAAATIARDSGPGG